MPSPHALSRCLLTTALAAALATPLIGCNQAPSATGKADEAGNVAMSEAQMAEHIAATLQACSYDGSSERIDPNRIGGPAPANCRDMVDRIMTYTGLPPNFEVLEAPVANAVAVIMLDDHKVPERVIAFNPDFIDAVRQQTDQSRWAPMSIMAHEIGHHLSGHTITASGSRPAIELEADKFSGYVLYKMGAPLAAATTAIKTFGSDTDQPTHPSKRRRVAAITQGWQAACRQAGGNCDSGAAATPNTGPDKTPAVSTASLPTPSDTTIPFKYGRFVVDETGKLDRDTLGALAQKMQALARKQGLELVLLVVNDLHGMSAQDYAWAMMRQLRIGKLDLGNGGVFVVAPEQGQAAVAFAPGVAKQLQFGTPAQQFTDWIAESWQPYCKDEDGCGVFTKSLVGIVESQLHFVDDVSWQIRFHSIEDIIAYTNERRAERRKGRDWDDSDMTIGSLVRFSGTVTDLDPEPELLKVNERIVKDGSWRAIVVKADEDGREVTLYMQPQTPGVMPSGPLQVGQHYTFTGELQTPGQFTTDKGVIQGNPGLWMFSYDAL